VSGVVSSGRTTRLLAALLSFSLAAPLSLLATAPVAQAQPKADEKKITLAIGENKTVIANDVKNYSEGPAGIAEIRVSPDGKKFIIIGVKAGTTSLLLIKNDGTQTNYVISVFSQAPELVETELRQLLEGYTGLRVRKIGQRLFIEGGVSTEADKNNIKQIADIYSGQVESLVTVGTGATDRNLNVRVDFYFVQYNKSSSYGFGLSMPARIGGEAIQSTFGYDFVAKTPVAQAAIVNQPLPGLDIASSHGWAKVIKQSTVITTNGSEATFENGGEENYAVTSGLQNTIEKIQFGTNVTVLPRFDPQSRNLEVKVKANVADLTPPTTSSLPGRQTAKLETLVFLKLGQSLVLSGIRTSGQRHSIRGVPLLSRIPVLGVFFGSHFDQEDEVEGAVFIIPSIVEATANADIVKQAMVAYADYDGNIDSVSSYPKTPPSMNPDAPPAAAAPAPSKK
jgi:pilus assembly protein CpaC